MLAVILSARGRYDSPGRLERQQCLSSVASRQNFLVITLAIIRVNCLSIEHVRRLSKCQVIGHAVEVAVLFSLLHVDGLEEQSLPLPCPQSRESSPNDPVPPLPA